MFNVAWGAPFGALCVAWGGGLHVHVRAYVVHFSLQASVYACIACVCVCVRVYVRVGLGVLMLACSARVQVCRCMHACAFASMCIHDHSRAVFARMRTCVRACTWNSFSCACGFHRRHRHHLELASSPSTLFRSSMKPLAESNSLFISKTCLRYKKVRR